MRIGTLIFDIFGELIFNNSVEVFISSMDQILLSVSDSFDSEYRRFAFYAAVIKIEVPLNIFWKNDIIYNSLISNLNQFFNNWSVDVFLHVTERGQ